MRIIAWVSLVGLASTACGGGEIASSDGGVAPHAASSPDASTPSSPPDGSASPPSSSGGSSSSSGGGACPSLKPDTPPGAVGAPCFSFHEGDPSFAAAVEQEVSTDTGNPQCGSGDVCLYNHFRGRVTCPYGQDSTGRGPAGQPGCLAPGTCEPVRPTDPSPALEGESVAAQCAGRPAASAVYCSCRCANVNGGTDDGTYCQCPSGMMCTQVVASLGLLDPGQPDISGAYCVKTGTEWDGGGCEASCDPTSAPCP